MFEPIDKQNSNFNLSFTFDGETVMAELGMSVATALLAANVLAIRETPVSGTSRGPFCMMGACYDCLVSVDGITVQACLTPVRPGMLVARVPQLMEDA